MSEPTSALMNRETGGSVQIRDAGLTGMILLRGDLSNGKLASAVKSVAGVKPPEKNGISSKDGYRVLWMSPDELLLVGPYAETKDAIGKLESALSGQHFMAADVSDARAVLRLEGSYVREVLAKLAPVDLHPDALPDDTLVRSRLGQIAAAFWLSGDSATVICFRSVADYAFDLLAASAKAGPVGHFPRGT